MKCKSAFPAFQKKPVRFIPALLVFGCLLWMPLTTIAQYSEPFSTPNKGYKINCVNDIAGINWSLTPWDATGTCQAGDFRDPSDYLNTTVAGVLESIDLDQEVCWESPLINTTAAPVVSVKVDLTWASFDSDVTTNTCGTDYIKVLYSVNGGPYVMVPNVAGGGTCATVVYPFSNPGTTENMGSFSINHGGIAGGSTLKIRVCMVTASNAEKVTIDNVAVPEAGVTVGCAAPVLSTVVTQVGCSNPNSGAIDLGVSAGTPPYTYDWSNNGSQNPDTDPQDLSGLPVGPYTVTVTDAASCTATTSVNITNAPALALSTQVLNTNCSGTIDGEIDLAVSGGVPGYTYDWSNNGAQNPDTDQQDLIGVGTGTYTVTITDASGCTSTTSAMVGTLPATAYNEQFNIANKGYLPNYVDNFSGVNWTMSSWSPAPPATFGRETGDYFRTNGGVLEGIDFDQEICWTSPLIDLNTGTMFSVNLAWTLFDQEDYINVKYSINGGAYLTLPNALGNGAAGTIQYPFPTLDQSSSMTVTKTGLSGSTIQIQVCGNFNNESIIVDNVSVPNSTTYCPIPDITLTPTNVTCVGGNNGNILVMASGAMPGYHVSWSGQSSGNPAGTEIASSGGSYNIPNLTAGMYTVSVTDANGQTASSTVTLTALNPLQNAAFSYANPGYCQTGSDPTPVIYGNTGGMFSAPAQISINPLTGAIDVSASTVGGPYTITYTNAGPCAGTAIYSVSIVNCQPGATLTDAISIDNGAAGKADPGDRIRLTATISNAQAADYQGVQLNLNNDPKVTLVANSFKTTPVAVNDAYTATMNVELNIVTGSGLLQNDFDDNIPGLSVTGYDLLTASNGTVSVNPNGSFTYTPSNGFTGNDSFNYIITDSDMQTNLGTVNIRVQ